MDKTRLQIEFNESLSNSSIKLIKKLLLESLNYETKINEEKRYTKEDVKNIIIIALEEANDNVLSECRCSAYGVEQYIDIDFKKLADSIIYEYEVK